MRHDIQHDLPLDVALTVARKAVSSYEQRFAAYEFGHSWRGDSKVALSFQVAGKRLAGSLEVHRDRLTFELKVPLLLRVFRNRALEILEKEARLWIERGRMGQLS